MAPGLISTTVNALEHTAAATVARSIFDVMRVQERRTTQGANIRRHSRFGVSEYRLQNRQSPLPLSLSRITLK